MRIAESILTRKMTNDPAAVAEVRARTDEAIARAAQIRAQTAKGTEPPQTVQPGEGVRGPDGTYTVPIPTKPAAPAKTRAQIDQEAADAHARAVREAANSQTPAQVQTDALQRIAETARQQGATELQVWQTKVDAGYIMTPKDEKELDAKLKEIAADAQAQRDQTQAQFTHDLEQSNKNTEYGIQQQNATTNATQVENTRVSNEQTARLRSAEGQAKALTDQSTAGQAAIKMGVEAGVAPSMGVIQYAFSPLRQAQALMQEAIAAGKAPPSAMPTPRAPQPAPAAAGPASAPLPAPGAALPGAYQPGVTY